MTLRQFISTGIGVTYNFKLLCGSPALHLPPLDALVQLPDHHVGILQPLLQVTVLRHPESEHLPVLIAFPLDLLAPELQLDDEVLLLPQLLAARRQLGPQSLHAAPLPAQLRAVLRVDDGPR